MTDQSYAKAHMTGPLTKTVLAAGIALIAMSSTAFAAECVAPKSIKAFEKERPDLPWCLKDYEETGQHDCSNDELDDYLDDVDTFYRAMHKHLKKSRTHARKMRRFAHCQANQVEAAMPPNDRYRSPLSRDDHRDRLRRPISETTRSFDGDYDVRRGRWEDEDRGYRRVERYRTRVIYDRPKATRRTLYRAYDRGFRDGYTQGYDDGDRGYDARRPAYAVKNCIGADGRYYRAYVCDEVPKTCKGKLVWNDYTGSFHCVNMRVTFQRRGPIESHSVRY